MAGPASERFEAHWPPGVDGVTVFPDVHRLAYEDAAVRLVDVRIAPRSSERPHTHALPSLMAIDGPTTLAVRWVDGRGRRRVVFERVRPPRRKAGLELQWLEPEPYHYVENTSGDEYRALRLELKALPAPEPAPRIFPRGLAARAVVAAGGVRALRLRVGREGPSVLRVEAAGAWLLGAERALRELAASARTPAPIAFGAERPAALRLEPGAAYDLTCLRPLAAPLWVIAYGPPGPHGASAA